MTLQRRLPVSLPDTTQLCRPAPRGSRTPVGEVLRWHVREHAVACVLAHGSTEPGSTGRLRDVETLERTATESIPGLETTDPAGGAAARARALELPAVDGKIAQYEIIRPLGRGGMGAVYLARDLRLGRRVAVKFLTGHRRHGNERFLAETRVTARCNHENIVVIHDVGEHEGRPYMVLEYVEGQTLSAWLEERTRIDVHAGGRARQRRDGRGAGAGKAPLPPSLAVELMIPVMRALACAHEMGIVHRDLKPANIMLTRAGTIKVLDFGIAKLIEQCGHDDEPWPESMETEPGMILGTPPYMPPEQLAGDDVDHRADIWAVGIMLFEMVTGVHPALAAAGVDAASPLALRCLLTTTDPALAMPGAGALRSDLGPLAGIIDRCLIKDRNHRTGSARALLQELEAIAGVRGAAALGQDQSPFAGLAAFGEADADRFFGRARDITALVARLREQPLVTVAGPSGAGKSSLVRAGVIPALERTGEGWTVLTVHPGRRPLGALAEVLASLPRDSTVSGPLSGPVSGRADAAVDVAAPDALVARLRAEPGYLGSELRAWARARLRRPVIFVDRFEELYTLGASADERAAFLACLDAVADDAASPLRVILAVRADFLDRMAENQRFLEVVNRSLVFLSPLDRDGLRQALVRPLEACEHRMEHPGMVERILDELATTHGALPLLQFTAAELWARRDRARRVLTEASLRDLGGVAGVLASHADAVLAAMPAREARLARSVFLRLITPERTRALVTLGELRQASRDRAAMDRVLGHLIEARLLAVEGSTQGTVGSDEDDAEVEIVHESLIGAWPLLGRWLSENEEDALFLSRLRGAAMDWQRSGRDPGLLWTGQAAHDARTWRRRYAGVLAPAEARFLDAAFAALDRQSRFRRLLFSGALAGTTAIAIAMAWLAARAEHAARCGRDATRMAAVWALDSDPTTQLGLLRELECKDAPPPGAQQEAKRLLHAHVAQAIVSGHDSGVSSAEFSPDGARIVSASHDRTVRVWSRDGGDELRVLRGHQAGVRAAVFSPDGARVASASYDGTVRLWDLHGSREPLVLRGHGDWVWSVAFSPDGAHVAFNVVRPDGAAVGRARRSPGRGAERSRGRGHERGVQPRRRAGRLGLQGRHRPGVARGWHGTAPGAARPRRLGLVGGVQPRRRARRLGIVGPDRAGVERGRQRRAAGTARAHRRRDGGDDQPGRRAHRVGVGRRHRAGVERGRQRRAALAARAHRRRDGGSVQPRRHVAGVGIAGQHHAALGDRCSRPAPGAALARGRGHRGRVQPRRRVRRVGVGGRDRASGARGWPRRAPHLSRTHGRGQVGRVQPRRRAHRLGRARPDRAGVDPGRQRRAAGAGRAHRRYLVGRVQPRRHAHRVGLVRSDDPGVARGRQRRAAGAARAR